MRRLAFNILTLASLLLLLAAGIAWLLSYVRPLDWHALDVEHHPNWIMGRTLSRAQPVVTLAPQPIFDAASPEGYWRAWWLRSRSGRLTLVHQDANVGTAGDFVMTVPTRMFLISQVNDFALYIIVKDAAAKPRTWVERLGFAYDRSDGATLPGQPRPPAPLRATVQALTLPFWPFVLLGLPLPLLWLRRRRRAAVRARRGLCAGCGYDLRETPERCPECGREATP